MAISDIIRLPGSGCTPGAADFPPHPSDGTRKPRAGTKRATTSDRSKRDSRVKSQAPRRNRTLLRELEKTFAALLVPKHRSDSAWDDDGVPHHDDLCVEAFEEDGCGSTVVLRAGDGAWISLTSADGRVWEGACALAGGVAAKAGRTVRFSLDRVVSGMMVVGLARSVFSGERMRAHDHNLEL